MSADERPPAGFESHWDADWFRNKAEECRRLAAISMDPNIHGALMDLGEEFQSQGEHAERLASLAFGRPQRAASRENGR